MIYDNANRVITSYTGSILYATTNEYYQTGQLKKSTDANGNATQYLIDKAGRLIRTTNALNNYTEYAYDLAGNRLTVTYYRDTNPINTTYTYYNNNRLKTTTYPGFSGTNTTTNVYDGNGNLLSKTDGNSQTISYQYDYNNRLKLKTYPDYSTVAYTYDANSNVLTTIDPNTDTANEYDDLNRLTKVTNNKYSPAKVIEYGYYEDGTRSSMLDAEGNLTEYSYDNAKRLTQLKLNSTLQATYNYNKLGLRTSLALGNGCSTAYGYDSTTRWLTSLTNNTSTSTTISSFVYTHDLVGNRKTMTLASGDVVNYNYDNIYQLTSEARNGSITYTNMWTYDKVGNRSTQDSWDGSITTTTTYTYNDANQLTQEVTGLTTTTYTFDGNGNQTNKTDGTNSWAWGYDYENRQISYTDPITTNNATYVYNAGGARIQKTVNGTIEKYILDGPNVVADYDWSNNVKAMYVTSFLDQNLLTFTSTYTSAYYFFHDGLGSVRNLVDSASSVVNSYDYYAFGETLSVTSTVTNRYMFTGREWDVESSTYYYRARQYNQSNGRFTQRDPTGYLGGLDLYSYVQNNPIQWLDPYGNRTETRTYLDLDCVWGVLKKGGIATLIYTALCVIPCANLAAGTGLAAPGIFVACCGFNPFCLKAGVAGALMAEALYNCLKTYEVEVSDAVTPRPVPLPTGVHKGPCGLPVYD